MGVLDEKRKYQETFKSFVNITNHTLCCYLSHWFQIIWQCFLIEICSLCILGVDQWYFFWYFVLLQIPRCSPIKSVWDLTRMWTAIFQGLFFFLMKDFSCSQKTPKMFFQHSFQNLEWGKQENLDEAKKKITRLVKRLLLFSVTLV